MKDDKTKGVAFPIIKKIWKKIIQINKPVFFKFMLYESLPKNLKIRATLFFYLSNSGKILVGEAKIENIKMIKPVEFFQQYKKKIILSESVLLT